MSTVTISCKTPNGVHLDVGPNRVTVNGYNSQNAFVIEGFEKVGLTYDVPEDHWKKWLEANKNHPLHLNGFIFAGKTENEARAKSKENKGAKTGMEQIDVSTLKGTGVESA